MNTTTPLNIAVLGAGAMGSLFGGQLARAGANVRLLTTNQRHIDAIRQNGLRLTVDEGEFTVRVDALQTDAPGSPADLVILFTKTYRSQEALRQAAHLIDEHTHVLTVQNGLGNKHRVKPFIPVERTIIGTSNLPADFTAPGRVSSHGSSRTVFALANGETSSFVDDIATLFNHAGIPAEVDTEVETRIWEKAAFNVAANPVLGIARATPGVLGQCEEALQLALDAASEACAVAKTEGIIVDVAGVHDHIRWACANHPHHKPSMLQDLLAGRDTEIDALCAEVVRLGQAAGIPTPCNDVLWRLVKLAELANRTARGSDK
jgi:2-dehydropantoate 2-reductase